MSRLRIASLIASAIALLTVIPASAQQSDRTAHKIEFVTTTDGIRLEVIDWGGNGSPVIFLAGFGNTAHSFDSFAPRFTASHHVYGITRRGFGASATPPLTLESYDPDRLADDILEVMTALKIDRPFLIGHSIAGQELSSIGTRHPERVSGLVYLDAAMHYAFYNPDVPDPFGDAAEAIRDLKSLRLVGQHNAIASTDRLKVSLEKLQNWIGGYKEFLQGAPPAYWSLTERPDWAIQNAMLLSERHYNRFSVPFLALTAIPCGGTCDDGKSARTQADYVAVSQPNGRVIQLIDADHNIWLSNGPVVEMEIDRFLLDKSVP
jgi:pimeloyl-ACP methyl ester carboxylesterase